MVQHFDDAYVAGATDVFIDYNGDQKKFIVRELGYMAVQSIAIKAHQQQLNSAALLVAESVETETGEKFTYDEVIRLKKNYAEAFLTAAQKLNLPDDSEKK